MSKTAAYRKFAEMIVIEDKCLGCGQCAIGCPEEAIRMIEAREPGFIPE